jgi:hypothetical protein
MTLARALRRIANWFAERFGAEHDPYDDGTR